MTIAKVRYTPMEGIHHGYTAIPLRDNASPKKTRSAKVPMCQVNGHDWITSVSDKVQVCSRKECKQMRQLIQGHWRFVVKRRGNKSKKDFIAQMELREQLAMWNSEDA